ncbi:TIGR03792 family protein [Prochlorococcus sp. AH-716-I19]|nr:TIGR03792 family protein [Prochlorococcus sp. AH-716-I19]
MRINYKIKEKIKKLSFLFICLLVFLFQINSPILKALPMDTYQNGLVTEELRLKIPSEFKKIWLQAEKEVWEPWLSIQDGFLGRQIFWDKEKEEALILVNWENKKLWKSISMNEVNEVQEKFEENVKTSLNTNVNPFELIYEGELVKQG